jgi:beta-glucosidase
MVFVLVLALATLPFRDPTLPWAERTSDLVARLSLEEKALQLGRPSKYGRASSPPIDRLSLAGYNYGVECNSGMLEGYPQNIGLAATFNRTLLFHAGRGTGLGLRANSFSPAVDGANPYNYSGLSCWSPMINLMRHPLWGRNHEGYGEDPFLSGELAAAIVRGMQGNDTRYALINAGVKHLAAFDGPGNGGEANISGNDWFGTYLPPFDAAIRAGALSTMCTYAKLNGTYGCQNPFLLRTYLRDHLNFTGYVVSDQGAIHDPRAAMDAGCDIEDGNSQYTQLADLVRSGALDESKLDAALRRLFYVRMLHGEFDPKAMVPYRDEALYGLKAYGHGHAHARTAHAPTSRTPTHPDAPTSRNVPPPLIPWSRVARSAGTPMRSIQTSPCRLRGSR